MPFLHYENLSPSACWGLWQIAEPESQLLPQLSAFIDHQELALLAHPAKRLEWLSVRALCLELLGKKSLPLADISKDAFGKPYLVNQVAHLSFSHAGHWAVVALDRASPIGIDIERASPAIDRVAPRLFSQSELQQAPTLDRKTIFWCAKEAIYKLHGERGLDFKRQISLQWHENRFYGELLIHSTSQIACIARPWEDHWVVIATPLILPSEI